MFRLPLITLLLIPAAHAQIAVPAVGGSLSPPRLPALGLPGARAPLPRLTRNLRRRLHPLVYERKLQVLRLLHRYPRLIEADPKGDPIVRGEVLALSPSPAALSGARAAGFSIVRVRTLNPLNLRVIVLRAPSGTSTREALRELRHIDPTGTYDFNHIYTASGTTLGPAAASGATRTIPSRSRTGSVPVSSRTVLGLIDGGIEVRQTVFRREMIHQHGCGGHPVPSRHGTAVASLMIGRDGRFAGAAPGAVLYAANVYCGRPTGGAVDAIVAAFAWLAGERVPVINISLVGPPNALLRRVVDRVLARGTLIVAAVGNDGPAAPPLYPAAYPGVIGVTAVDAAHRVLFEAERGPQVMFCAPGADIDAAAVPRGLAPVRGTSFAAPLVAGLLALRLHRPDPAAARAAVQTLIHRARHLGAPGRNPLYGYGLLAARLPAHRARRGLSK